MSGYIRKIGLGTAQWGMPYGVSNRLGQTSTEEISRILKIANQSGISLLDTASAYGNAEQAIGAADITSYKVITKTPKFGSNNLSNTDTVLKTFKISLERLNLHSTYGLLVHDASDLLSKNGESIIRQLMEIKAEGLTTKVGVSAYNAAQIENILNHFKPDIVQIPINVFDQRLIRDGTIKKLSDLGIEIHARSTFLQGLLLMSVDEIPKYFSRWLPVISAWQKYCKDQTISPLHLAMDFVGKIPEVSYVLVGIQNHKQLCEIIEGPSISNNINLDKFANDDQRLVDPSRWKLI